MGQARRPVDEDRAQMERRAAILATGGRRYSNRPSDYIDHLRALAELDTLRARRGRPPLPREDDPARLRARAKRLGLIDAQA